jgi:hypothetical protein
MAKGKLFEYAVLYHPRATKEQRDAGETPKTVLVNDIKTTLAESDKEVGILAARALPEEYLTKLEDVEIVIRPF